eukprot:6193851-Pleurochrysis_carterae.AAC.1
MPFLIHLASSMCICEMTQAQTQVPQTFLDDPPLTRTATLRPPLLTSFNKTFLSHLSAHSHPQLQNYRMQPAQPQYRPLTLLLWRLRQEVYEDQEHGELGDNYSAPQPAAQPVLLSATI